LTGRKKDELKNPGLCRAQELTNPGHSIHQTSGLLQASFSIVSNRMADQQKQDQKQSKIKATPIANKMQKKAK
jgi:hypothetical protein